MVNSMTAFGRSKFSLNDRVYILEIYSVNRKGLEVSVNLPNDLSFLEIFIRSFLKNICLRGYITCKIFHDSSKNHRISSESMKLVHEKLVSIASEIDKEYKVSFDNVLQVALKGAGVIEMGEKEAEKTIEKALDQACKAFVSMRENEGDVLKEDISDRLVQIQKTCEKISSRGEDAPRRMEERITERLSEISTVKGEDKDRLMREVIIYTDKYDVTEEMTRMNSHIGQMNDLINTKKSREAIGRTLEFLLQEMLREVNTTSAKSQDLGIISEVIFIKREIEKIREQVQNIE